MSGSEIAVLVVVCVAFVAALTAIVVRKVKGKGSCCDCSSCAFKTGDTACGGGCPHCTGGAPHHK